MIKGLSGKKPQISTTAAGKYKFLLPKHNNKTEIKTRGSDISFSWYIEKEQFINYSFYTSSTCMINII